MRGVLGVQLPACVPGAGRAPWGPPAAAAVLGREPAGVRLPMSSRPLGLTIPSGHTWGHLGCGSGGTVGRGRDVLRVLLCTRRPPPPIISPEPRPLVQMSLHWPCQGSSRACPASCPEGLNPSSPLPAPAGWRVPSSCCLWLGCLWAPTTNSGGSSGFYFYLCSPSLFPVEPPSCPQAVGSAAPSPCSLPCSDPRCPPSESAEGGEGGAVGACRLPGWCGPACGLPLAPVSLCRCLGLEFQSGGHS